MRIITGSARGTHLLTLEGDNTRPTSERTKEAVFSILQFQISDKNILDVFSGSGQMALEALSRGASYAQFIDSSKEAYEIIKKNAEKTHLSQKCKITNGDAIKTIEKIRDIKFDLCFIDPPYALGIIPMVLEKLYDCNVLNEDAVLVCESADFSDVFGSKSYLTEKFEVFRTEKYGIAHISFLRPKY